jgi:RsiW-degrading membrane proteinase PrsW (M82 family)
MSFGVVMGYFYGRAKIVERQHGDAATSKRVRRFGVLLAAAMHGFYDTCASLGSAVSGLVFIVFVIVMFVCVFRMVKREAKTDEPI